MLQRNFGDDQSHVSTDAAAGALAVRGERALRPKVVDLHRHHVVFARLAAAATSTEKPRSCPCAADAFL